MVQNLSPVTIAIRNMAVGAMEDFPTPAGRELDKWHACVAVRCSDEKRRSTGKDFKTGRVQVKGVTVVRVTRKS